MSKAGQPAFAFGPDWLKMTVLQRKSVDFHKKTLKICNFLPIILAQFKKK